MIKRYIYIISGLFIFTQTNIFSQEPNPSSFFPSSVGNIWQYDSEFGFFRRELIKDSLLEDNSILIFFNTLQDAAFKIDTLNQVYYDPYTLNWFYYKLDAVLGESWIVFPENKTNGLNRRDARVDSVYQAFLFGEIRTVKKIGYYDLEFGDTVINDGNGLGWEYIVSGIGEYITWDAHSGPTRILRGCIINGDTLGVITAIMDEHLSITNYKMQQNYPNPFNPVTTIEYSLAKSSDVSLIIYNILGEKVEVLVEEYKNAGNYEILFDASSLPSGIYVYTLVANNFSSSKKMILIK